MSSSPECTQCGSFGSPNFRNLNCIKCDDREACELEYQDRIPNDAGIEALTDGSGGAD